MDTTTVELTRMVRAHLIELVPQNETQKLARELAIADGSFRAMRSVYMELCGEQAELAAGADRNARNRARKQAQERAWCGAGPRPRASDQVMRGILPFAPAAPGSKLYAYRIIHEVGFAPNVTGSVLTLATCKPVVRRNANIGDYVLGLLPAAFNYAPAFLAVVTDKISMQQYWDAPEWMFKKPHMNSVEGLYGDNAYETLADGSVIQHPCNHSLPRWTYSEDKKHKAKDTSGQFVLISHCFYFGGEDNPLYLDDAGLLYSVIGANENIRGHRVFPGEVGAEVACAIERAFV